MYVLSFLFLPQKGNFCPANPLGTERPPFPPTPKKKKQQHLDFPDGGSKPLPSLDLHPRRRSPKGKWVFKRTESMIYQPFPAEPDRTLDRSLPPSNFAEGGPTRTSNTEALVNGPLGLLDDDLVASDPELSEIDYDNVAELPPTSDFEASVDGLLDLELSEIDYDGVAELPPTSDFEASVDGLLDLELSEIDYDGVAELPPTSDFEASVDGLLEDDLSMSDVDHSVVNTFGQGNPTHSDAQVRTFDINQWSNTYPLRL
jgi:hypothetical protein